MSKRNFLTELLENATKEKALTEEEIKLKIKILPQFQGLIPPLLADELGQLESNILLEGCREPLILWKNEEDYVLVDGHNRFSICQKHQIHFKIVVKDFQDENEAKTWMINNQLGRRNLSLEQQSYLRGMRYEQEKEEHGGDRKSKQIKGKNFPLENTNTAKKLANEYHVSDKTIKNDAQFAKGIEVIGENNPQIKQNILSGKSQLSKADIQALGKLESKHLKDVKEEKDLLDIIQHHKNAKNLKRDTNDKKIRIDEIVEALSDSGNEVVIEIRGSFLLRKGLADYWQALRKLKKPITEDFTDSLTWEQAQTMGLIK
jgi:hypothetical protein